MVWVKLKSLKTHGRSDGGWGDGGGYVKGVCWLYMTLCAVSVHFLLL